MAVVSEDNFGTDVYATEAAFKKHETLEADVKVWGNCVYMYQYNIYTYIRIQVCIILCISVCITYVNKPVNKSSL